MQIGEAFYMCSSGCFPPEIRVFAVLEYAWKSGKEVIDGNDFFIPPKAARRIQKTSQ
jgi:hypothetical protein